jgi:hypothetical protein
MRYKEKDTNLLNAANAFNKTFHESEVKV